MALHPASSILLLSNDQHDLIVDSHFPTRHLLQKPLFNDMIGSLTLSPQKRAESVYARAREVILTYKFTSDNLIGVSPLLWQMHLDPIWTIDSSAAVIATIHVNLVMGTLAMYKSHASASELLPKLARFEVNGQFCLTELGHGLDAFALETRVDLMADDTLLLNTPSPQAAKFMPPTGPRGYATTAIVFARLFVRGRDHGIKTFIVPINDGVQMCEGVMSRQLYPRGGSNPVPHTLTSFHNVRLPLSALLGSIDRAVDQKAAFFNQIDRVVTGTLIMGGFATVGLHMSTAIAAAYFQRRHVSNPISRKPISILSFPNQSTSVLTAIAQTQVFYAYGEQTRQQFNDCECAAERHFLAAVWKVTSARMAMNSMQTLIDGCGAQGLFEVNQLTALLDAVRSSSVAEGDIQGLAIRFLTDLALGRVTLAPSSDESSVISRHETGLLIELEQNLRACMSSPQEFAAIVHPRASRIIESIGHRMAIDAARHANVDDRLIAVFEAFVVGSDPSWYSEDGVSREQQAHMQHEAIRRATPSLQDFISSLGGKELMHAPMISNEKWDSYVSRLVKFEHSPGGELQDVTDDYRVKAKL